MPNEVRHAGAKRRLASPLRDELLQVLHETVIEHARKMIDHEVMNKHDSREIDRVFEADVRNDPYVAARLLGHIERQRAGHQAWMRRGGADNAVQTVKRK